MEYSSILDQHFYTSTFGGCWIGLPPSDPSLLWEENGYKRPLRDMMWQSISCVLCCKHGVGWEMKITVFTVLLLPSPLSCQNRVSILKLKASRIFLESDRKLLRAFQIVALVMTTWLSCLAIKSQHRGNQGNFWKTKKLVHSICRRCECFLLPFSEEPPVPNKQKSRCLLALKI